MKKWIIPLAGIVAITILESVALANGINGAGLSVAFAAIGALVAGGAIKTWPTKGA